MGYFLLLSPSSSGGVSMYNLSLQMKNKKSLMIPDSLYLDMMIDISDGQQFCFDEDGFEFFEY